MQEAQTSEQTVTASRDRIPWGWVIATTVGLEVLAAISAFVWVAIYSYLIHPGEDVAFYRNYAQYASPVVSLVAGTPYWYFGCRWVARKAGNRAVAMSLWAWSILCLINVPLTFLSETPAFSWTVVALSLFFKLVAAYLGGKSALASTKTQS